IGSGWHSGISSQVRLAAMMPATLAVPNASPLGRSPVISIGTTSGRVAKMASAVATRLVTALSLTSTIWAVPSSRRWVSFSDIHAPSFDALAGSQLADAYRDMHQRIGAGQ